MSHLREIMQKLAAAQPAGTEKPTPQPSLPQLEAYRQQLQQCNEAMLHYEWTWLYQHLDDLQLCNANSAMAQAAGGSQHVRQLILQAQTYLAALAKECERRGVQPQRQAHSVASAEHAWEVSNSAIRRAWGLDG
jgi:glycine/D-amino acid oxidase-like deaminating enzyme